MITFNEYPIDENFDPEELASRLDMNWDSENGVLYKGTDKANGFKITIATNYITVNSWISNDSTGANYTIYSPVRYIFNSDETACAWGGAQYSSGSAIPLFWAEAKSPSDSNKHYLFGNTSNNGTNGSNALWTYGAWYYGFFSANLYKSSLITSFAPLAVDDFPSNGYPSIPLYCENVYLQIVGNSVNNYQAIELDGYDYLILTTGGNAERVRVVLPIGESS